MNEIHTRDVEKSDPHFVAQPSPRLINYRAFAGEHLTAAEREYVFDGGLLYLQQIYELARGKAQNAVEHRNGVKKS